METEFELEITRWFSSLVECRICGHQHMAVYPEDADEDNLECNQCHNLSCEPVEDE